MLAGAEVWARDRFNLLFPSADGLSGMGLTTSTTTTTTIHALLAFEGELALTASDPAAFAAAFAGDARVPSALRQGIADALPAVDLGMVEVASRR